MKTLTAPMKKHLKMTTAELIAERENEIACIAHTTARIAETDPSDTRYIAVMRGWITGSKKAISSIDLALEQRA
jgi:hypothetical protein